MTRERIRQIDKPRRCASSLTFAFGLNCAAFIDRCKPVEQVEKRPAPGKRFYGIDHFSLNSRSGLKVEFYEPNRLHLRAYRVFGSSAINSGVFQA
jgi:hypothetical protein